MFRKKLLRVGAILLLLAAVLLVARIALPSLLQRYVNRTLDRIPTYDGEIGDVDLHLWRGAYSIQNVKIVKTTKTVPVPLFEAPLVDLSLQWKALLEGKAVGEVVMKRPVLNFVHGRSEERSQTSVDAEWLDAVKDLFPLRINRFQINDGTVHFRNFDAEPKVNVTLTKVQALGTNFSNTRRAREGLVATIDGTGFLEEHADFRANCKLEPAASKPTFVLVTSVNKLNLVSLNDFLKAYAKVDAESGTMSIDLEMNVKQGKFEGYLKPLLKNVKILNLETDSPNPLQAAWEALAAFFAEIFENQKHEQIGTKVPFSGSLDDPQMGILAAIVGVLNNAFVKALKPGLEGETFNS